MSEVSAIPPAGAVPIATSAIKQSLTKLDKDANVVANSTNVTTPDTLAALVDAKQQVLYTRAAARMISAADEMVSSLLDVRA